MFTALIIAISAITSSPAFAVKLPCELELVHGTVQKKTGFYTFKSGRASWVGNDGSKIEAYYTATASHREILRRQVGEKRYAEIMAARDPEAAAREAMARPEATSAIRSRMSEIPLDQALTAEMINETLSHLESAGIYADSFEQYLKSNGHHLRGLGQRPVDIKFVDVELVIGGESAPLALRLYKSLNEDGEYHIRIVEAAKAFISGDRLKLKFGHRADPGSYGSIWLGPIPPGDTRGLKIITANHVPPVRSVWTNKNGHSERP